MAAIEVRPPISELKAICGRIERMTSSSVSLFAGRIAMPVLTINTAVMTMNVVRDASRRSFCWREVVEGNGASGLPTGGCSTPLAWTCGKTTGERTRSCPVTVRGHTHNMTASKTLQALVFI